MKWLTNWWKQRVRLATGEIEFTVPTSETDTEVWRSDLITLKIVAEEQEALHEIKRQSDGTLAATPLFLEKLSLHYEALGCPKCTPTMARQIWIVVAERFIVFESEFQTQLTKVLR